MNLNIGIIGFGFVGKAIAFGFSPCKDVPITYYDPVEPTSTPMERLVTCNDILFVCVPTPMCGADGGEIDTTIMDGVLNHIAHLTEPLPVKPIVCIKSTVTPNALVKYIAHYPTMRLTMAPEFLTERTANLDFINATRIVLGGHPDDTKVLEDLHRRRFLHTPIYHCDLVAASLVKYMCNTFFAVKLAFMNEMLDIYERSGTATSWHQLLQMFLADNRIGNSHYNVPGPDGKKGFGGKCLPKDLNAMIHYAETLGFDAKTLKAAWERNLLNRPERDWEKISGAVSKKTN